MSKLKDKVAEFADIAKSLPDNLQPICFELLLRHHLESLTTKSRPSKDGEAGDEGKAKATDDAAGSKGVEDALKRQEDLSAHDVHLKVRKFLEKYGLSVSHLNNVFYKEGDQILPLYEDLKTTRVSESQIRVSLLQALWNALHTGDFQAKIEEVRKECIDRKCYDAANFAAHFRNNKTLFDFDNYTKTLTHVRLSENGRKELASLIKELQ